MKQKEQRRRRAIVLQIIAMQGSANPKAIQDILQTEHKIKASYQTVSNDITHIKQTNAQWFAKTTSTGWENQHMTLYRETNNEITQLREWRDIIIAQGDVERDKVASIDKVIIEKTQFLKDLTGGANLHR